MKRIQINMGLWAALPLLGMLFTACSATDDAGTQSSSGPLELKAELGGMTSRSATASSGAWTAGDIVAVQDGANTPLSYTVSDAATGAMAATTAGTGIYWTPSEGDKTITAWSYGGGAFSASLPADYGVATDQSTLAKVDACDFLYAAASTAKKGIVKTLAFAHEMAQILIRTKCGDALADGSVPSGAVTLASQITDMTLRAKNKSTFASTGWTMASDAAVAKITPYTAVTAPTGYLTAYTALVLPQDMSGEVFLTFTATVDGVAKTYSFTPATGKAAFTAGNLYVFDITFLYKDVTVSTVSAGAWTSVTGGVTATQSELIYNTTGSTAWTSAGSVTNVTGM